MPQLDLNLVSYFSIVSSVNPLCDQFEFLSDIRMHALHTQQKLDSMTARRHQTCMLLNLFSTLPLIIGLIQRVPSSTSKQNKNVFFTCSSFMSTCVTLLSCSFQKQVSSEFQ